MINLENINYITKLFLHVDPRQKSYLNKILSL